MCLRFKLVGACPRGHGACVLIIGAGMAIENVTSEQIAGPFYPTSEQLKVDNDLTWVEKRTSRCTFREAFEEI